MVLETKIKEALELVELKKLDMDIANDTYSKPKCDNKNQTKREAESPSPIVVTETKIAYEAACKVQEKTGHKFEVAGANVFQLYATLLSNFNESIKACKPWDMVVNEEVNTTPGKT